ncbi:MAG TPA: NlpC/P60 family protein, partial [candidate division Zixibacteria bacterium]|nr:NlpC/P60 family protein [candidate division Zixibacteria bacterium]
SVWNSDAYEELGRILQRFLGVPYKGNSRYQAGIDCSRFTAEVYQEFDGRKLPRIASEQARLGAAVSRSGLEYGDLVFFKIGGGSVSHVGIYVGDGNFIHASESRGVVIDSLADSYWSKHFHSARRLVVDVKASASR